MEVGLKLLFTLSLLISASFAESSKCTNKFQESTFKISGCTAFGVSESTGLLYSDKPLKSAYIKHDPFLGLYLVKSTRKIKHPFEIVPKCPKNLGFITLRSEGSVKVLKKQIGLNNLARIDKKVEASALITSSCCQLNGIVAKNSNVIERDYIENFLAKKSVDYGDVGIRVTQGKVYPKVIAADPFFPYNPFLEKDEIVSINGKEIKSASKLMQMILFKGSNKRYRFSIIRDGKRLKFSLTSRKRLGGGLLSDTFIEPLGMGLDNSLRVVNIKKDSQIFDAGITLGDRLLKVGRTEVHSLNQIRPALSKEHSSKDKKVLILFERNSFQFFIQIPKIR